MAKHIEKEAEFLSSDDAQISKLQNKKDIKLPTKRVRKQKVFDTSDEESSQLSGNYFFQRISVIYYFNNNCKCIFLIIVLYSNYYSKQT